MKKRIVSFVLALVLALSLTPAAFAAVSDAALDSAVAGSAAYIYTSTPAPQVGSIGGEWAVLGLARSGYSVPEKYYRDYYARVEQYVRSCKGVLHEKKYTEYSRVVVALSAIGEDPTNVAGYDLLTPLADFDKTIWQGINGPIWALIALDSRDYPMPTNPAAKTQATRQMYIDEILSRQNNDGGWSLTSMGGANPSDPDITGMALQALAKYQSQPAVKTATDKALQCLSKMQNSDGSYTSGGAANTESIAQVIVALAELGIAQDDPRFVKNGNTMLDALMRSRKSNGSFQHTASGVGDDQMTAEQGFYALVAVQRQHSGQNSLYRMGDVGKTDTPAANTGAGLPGKNADVKQVPVTAAGTTFPDVTNHANKAAIEGLAARKIINGMGNGLFAPDNNMTRAEFATITVQALGLTAKATNVFSDVAPSAWYAPYVGTAYTYGIVKGRSATSFDPSGTITRQEAATMVARAAKLCGMDTDQTAAAVRTVLASFSDYAETADWAQASLAFCYDSGILDGGASKIRPTVAIKRCEIAQMLYNMLDKAQLL